MIEVQYESDVWEAYYEYHLGVWFTVFVLSCMRSSILYPRGLVVGMYDTKAMGVHKSCRYRKKYFNGEWGLMNG